MIRNREEEDDDDNYDQNDDDSDDDDNNGNGTSDNDNDESEKQILSNKIENIDTASDNSTLKYITKNDRMRSKRKGGNKMNRKSKKASTEESASSMSVSVDPYTFSLLRYASAKSDRKTCEHSCPIGPRSFQNSPKLREKGMGKVRHFSSDENQNNHSGHSTISMDYNVNEISVNNTSGIKHSMGPSSVVRVGYISYDCRSHPMGRLTKALLTTHSHSKVR